MAAMGTDNLELCRKRLSKEMLKALDGVTWGARCITMQKSIFNEGFDPQSLAFVFPIWFPDRPGCLGDQHFVNFQFCRGFA